MDNPDQKHRTKEGSPSAMRCLIAALSVAVAVVLLLSFYSEIFDGTFNLWNYLVTGWAKLYFDHIQYWSYVKHVFAFVWVTSIVYFACREDEKAVICSVFGMIINIFFFALLMVLYQFGFGKIIQASASEVRENPYLVFISTPLYFEDQQTLNKIYDSGGYPPDVVWDEEEWMVGESWREQVQENNTLVLTVDQKTCEKYAFGMELKNIPLFSDSVITKNDQDKKGDVFYKLQINGKPFEKLLQCQNTSNELVWTYVGAEGVSGAYPPAPHLSCASDSQEKSG